MYLNINIQNMSKEQANFICPKCGEKIKINSEKKDDIILSIKNIKDTIEGVKLSIDNIIKILSNNSAIVQLKNVNLILNVLNDDVTKINEKFNNLLSNNINNIDNEIKNENTNNYIIAEIIIREEDVNKNIKILNSYEHSANPFLRNIEEFKNENEIKNCEIQINGEKIPFNYSHKFTSKGKYIIKYSFKNNITNATRMFYQCSSLTNINLSNFNTSNVTNMSDMFNSCSSLTNINLSNFNTDNVTDAISMFAGCQNLKKENIIIKDKKILNLNKIF